MSSELCTPLGAILGFAQLIESVTPQTTSSQKRSVDQILQTNWNLQHFITEILSLASIESGKLSLSMEPVSLADVMQECETMIDPLAKKRGVCVSFLVLSVPIFVKVDRHRLKHVLINLLSNAIKYNSSWGRLR